MTRPDTPSGALAYHLSTVPPLGSFFGVEPVTLLVGLDEDGPDGALKVYLGARYKRVHLLVTDEDEKETFRRAWGSGGHVWMWPVPPAEVLHVDPAPQNDRADGACSSPTTIKGKPWCDSHAQYVEKCRGHQARNDRTGATP